MGFITGLLQNLQNLTRLLVIVAFLPLLLSERSSWSAPVFWGILLSLFFLQFGSLQAIWTKYWKMDPVNKLSVGFAIFSIFFLIGFFWIGFDMKPNVIINTILTIFLLLNWYAIILAEIDKYPYEPIFRGEVEASDIDRSFDGLIIPLTISGFMAILLILAESFIQSNAKEIFLVSTIRWLITPALVMIFGLAHSVFLQEINWIPNDGVTQYITQTAPAKPDSIEVDVMEQYLYQLEHAEPTEELFEYLDEHLPVLVNHCRELRYARVLHRLVRVYAIWGEKVADQIHYLHLLVAASLSRFRVLGIVPRYNRIMFYSYLELQYKLDNLPADWMKIIEFEALEGEDDYHLLDWIIGLPYGEAEETYRWISFWNGSIYRGNQGYEQLKQDRLLTSGSTTPRGPWQEDIRETVFSYLRVFIGPDKERLQGKYSLDDALDFLARKQRLPDFYQDQERRKNDLANPQNRYVTTSQNETGTKESRAVEMNAYLSGKSYYHTDDDMEIERSTTSIIQTLFELITRNFGNIYKFILVLVIAGVNIFLLWLLKTLVSGTIMSLIVAVEVVITQIYGISEPDNANAASRERVEESNEQNVTVNMNKTRKMKTGYAQDNAISLLYSFLLIFGYALFLL